MPEEKEEEEEEEDLEGEEDEDKDGARRARLARRGVSVVTDGGSAGGLRWQRRGLLARAVA